MSADELLRKLRTNQVPELILLHGQESYLVEQAVRAVRSAVLINNQDDFNDDQYYGKECTAAKLIDAALTLPVLAPRRLVTLKDAHLLPAAELDEQVSEAVKAERLAALQDELNRQQLAFNRGFEGRRMRVLLDRPGRSARQLIGRSPYMQAVHVDFVGDGEAPPRGALLDVSVTRGLANSLAAQPVA